MLTPPTHLNGKFRYFFFFWIFSLWSIIDSKSSPARFRRTTRQTSSLLKLYNMYSETEPLPVPDINQPSCVEQLAGIFIHLKRKAGGENLRFAFNLPLPSPSTTSSWWPQPRAPAAWTSPASPSRSPCCATHSPPPKTCSSSQCQLLWRQWGAQLLHLQGIHPCQELTVSLVNST